MIMSLRHHSPCQNVINCVISRICSTRRRSCSGHRNKVIYCIRIASALMLLNAYAYTVHGMQKIRCALQFIVCVEVAGRRRHAVRWLCLSARRGNWGPCCSLNKLWMLSDTDWRFESLGCMSGPMSSSLCYGVTVWRSLPQEHMAREEILWLNPRTASCDSDARDALFQWEGRKYVSRLRMAMADLCAERFPGVTAVGLWVETETTYGLVGYWRSSDDCDDWSLRS